MNILQVGKFYFRDHKGGVERVVFELYQGLKKSEIRSDILCANTQRKTAIYQEDGYTVYKAKNYGKLFSTAIAPRLISLLFKLKRNYDIIHIHHPDPLNARSIFIKVSRPGYNSLA